MTDSIAASQIPAAVRIIRVSIEKLFGTLDHLVQFNADARVTIVLGANGIGKTQLLECVSALFTAKLERLVAVPFTVLKVDLDDGTSLRVEQHTIEVPPRQSDDERVVTKETIARRIRRRPRVRRKLILQLFRHDGTPATDAWEPSSRSAHRRRGEIELPVWVEPDEFGYWYDQRSNRFLSTREMRVLHGYEEGALDDVPEWFKETLGRTSVRLIETQRLLRTHRKHARSIPDPRASTAVQFAVRDLVEDLLERMRGWRNRYTRQALTLDKSYVDRFLRYGASEESTQMALQERLSDIASRQERLERLSLLDAEESARSTTRLAVVAEEKLLALSLFASDMDQKLTALEEPADQLERLLDIVNRKLRGTNKKLVTDPHHGLIVETTASQQLDLEQLSSGEQHELVLLYDLLFRVRRQSLVLIDEPELSLHPAWQEEFVDDLMSIAKANEFDVVLATHSPYIVGARSALCVTLAQPQTPSP